MISRNDIGKLHEARIRVDEAAQRLMTVSQRAYREPANGALGPSRSQIVAVAAAQFALDEAERGVGAVADEAVARLPYEDVLMLARSYVIHVTMSFGPSAIESELSRREERTS